MTSPESQVPQPKHGDRVTVTYTKDKRSGVYDLSDPARPGLRQDDGVWIPVGQGAVVVQVPQVSAEDLRERLILAIEAEDLRTDARSRREPDYHGPAARADAVLAVFADEQAKAAAVLEAKDAEIGRLRRQRTEYGERVTEEFGARQEALADLFAAENSLDYTLDSLADLLDDYGMDRPENLADALEQTKRAVDMAVWLNAESRCLLRGMARRTVKQRQGLGAIYRLAEEQYAEQVQELRADRDRYKAAHESTQRALIRMEQQRDELRTAIAQAAGVDPEMIGIDTDFDALLAALSSRYTAVPPLAGLHWRATHVPPGTPDPEDTDTLIEPGWYVTGYDPERSDGPVVRMLVEHTVFRTGGDTAGEFARAIARVLATPVSESVPAAPMEMVRQFHQAFGLPIGDTSRTYNKLRADLVHEEAKEAADAIEHGEPEDWAKELADLVIVAYGAALTMGIDLDLAVRLVHESNMTKLGPDGRPVMREDGKVLKGPNYVPPDVTPAVLVDPSRASATSEASQLQANSKLEQNLDLGVGSASTPPASGFSAVLIEIAAERTRQDERWGEQNHFGRMPANYPVGDTPNAELAAFHWKNTNAARVAWMNEQGFPRDRNAAWDGILLEEVYEALAEDDPRALRTELIQVAAVATAWIEAIDRRTSPPSSPTSEGNTHDA